MLDPTLRGWILILAGAALGLYAGRRDPRFESFQGWGHRLIGAGLMLEGGAVHFEQSGSTNFAWLPWVALAIVAVGVALALVGTFRNRFA